MNILESEDKYAIFPNILRLQVVPYLICYNYTDRRTSLQTGRQQDVRLICHSISATEREFQRLHNRRRWFLG